MNRLTIRTEKENRRVEVPAEFIDIFMPDAAIEELKVYLYLLRASGDPSIRLSLGDMADLFDVTPKKVMTALNSWAEKGVLSLEYADGELCSVELKDLSDREGRRESEAPVYREPEKPLKETVSVKAAPVQEAANRPIDLMTLETDPDFTELLSLAEYYLQKPMTWQMREAVGNSYLLLDRNRDAAEYLLEYCVEQGHMAPAYIQSVARGWASEGLKTVEEIREAAAGRNKNVYSVKKAFGIRNRELVREELDYIGSWVRRFDLPIVLEACRRTVSQAEKPSFRYADAIISAWEKENVHTLQDIEDLDRKRNENTPRKETAAPRKTETAFHNFEQRGTDYNSLVERYLQ